MSWNFRHEGTDKGMLKAAVDQERYCPKFVKDVIAQRLDNVTVPDVNNAFLVVQSHGHISEGFGKDSIMIAVFPQGDGLLPG